MSSSRRFRPQIEVLEQRLPPAAMMPEPSSEPPPEEPNSATTTPVDPTDDPIDPGNDTITTQVVSTGEASDGFVYSITVDGSGFSDTMPTSIEIEIDGIRYAVDSATVLDDGNVVLTIGMGVDASAVSAGSDVTLIFGDGGYNEPPPNEPIDEPPPEEPPPDPTETPVDPTEAPAE